jgi:hypothetical protein
VDSRGYGLASAGLEGAAAGFEGVDVVLLLQPIAAMRPNNSARETIFFIGQSFLLNMQGDKCSAR